ncbi:hypothetical protein [Streptomyces solaniscabiei]|uniref:hypothetical protein n=1 Tax=Streptomyces solaniscabiei TaxID=2683255 RepID=UPI001CE245A7|nr:hypothetical protein [Streptomyces solaniscabiei]
MDNYEGLATLEWWANPSTCLGEWGVQVTVRVTGGGWSCDAVLEPPLSAEDREGFDFLMAVDPLFTLRFEEGSTMHVNVIAAGDDGRLTLTACEADAVSPGTGQLP